MKNKKTIGILAGFISAFIWGITFVSSKVLLEYLPTTSIAFIRYLISTVFLFIILKITKVDMKIELKDILRIFISGLSGIIVYYYLAAKAINTISVSMVGVLNGTIPIIILAIEVLFCGKETNKKIIFAFLISSIGILLTVIESNLFTGSKAYIGYVYMALAIAGWIIYTILTPKLIEKYSNSCVLFYQTVFGTLTLLPFGIYEIIHTKEFVNIISSRLVFANLLFLGILCSAAAYYLYSVSLDCLGSSMASIFTNFIPIVTMIAAYFVLGETITIIKFIGLCLVLLSIVFVQSDNYNKKDNSEKLCS